MIVAEWKGRNLAKDIKKHIPVNINNEISIGFLIIYEKVHGSTFASSVHGKQ